MSEDGENNYSTDNSDWHQGATIEERTKSSGTYEKFKTSQEVVVPKELEELHKLAKNFGFTLGLRDNAHSVHKLIEMISEKRDIYNAITGTTSPDETLAALTNRKLLPTLLGALAYGDPIILTWKKEAITLALNTCAKGILAQKQQEEEEYKNGSRIPSTIEKWRRAEALFASEVSYQIVPTNYGKDKVIIVDNETNRANPRYKSYFLHLSGTDNYAAYQKAADEIRRDEAAIQHYLDEQKKIAEAKEIMSRMTPEERQHASDPQYINTLLKSVLAQEKITLHYLKGERFKPGERVDDTFEEISKILKLIYLLPIEEREKWEVRYSVRRLHKEQNDLHKFLRELESIQSYKPYTSVKSA